MKRIDPKTGAIRAVLAMALLSGVLGAAHAGGGVTDPSTLGVLGLDRGIDVPLFEPDDRGKPLVSTDRRLSFDVLASGTLKGELHLVDLPKGSITSLLFGRRDDNSLAEPLIAPVGVAGMEIFTGPFDLVTSADGRALSFTRENLRPGRYEIGVALLIPTEVSGKLAGTLSVIPAVPEPATWLMLGVGLCGVAGTAGVGRKRDGQRDVKRLA